MLKNFWMIFTVLSMIIWKDARQKEKNQKLHLKAASIFVFPRTFIKSCSFIQQPIRTRPLTEEGKKDSASVLEFLKDKKIEAFYCSPYKRSMDTIAEAADFFKKEIITDERLRERESGSDGNSHGMFQKRWADHDYHEEGGESIAMVQRRNMEAFNEILSDNADKDIVVGTHGTALSTILNFYDNSFGCEDFLRIIDWMPYIIELNFEGGKLVSKQEHCHVEKEFKGK